MESFLEKWNAAQYDEISDWITHSMTYPNETDENKFENAHSMAKQILGYFHPTLITYYNQGKMEICDHRKCVHKLMLEIEGCSEKNMLGMLLQQKKSYLCIIRKCLNDSTQLQFFTWNFDDDIVAKNNSIYYSTVTISKNITDIPEEIKKLCFKV